jgi:hypothetical protein
MAGEWIAVDVGIGTKPEVLELQETTGATVDQVIGRMVQFWGWASMNTADGTLRGTPARLARLCGGDEPFWLSVERVGWLSFCAQAGTVRVVGWEQRFSHAAKARILDARRKSISRGKNGNVRQLSGSCPDSVRVMSENRPVDLGPEESRVEESRVEKQPTVVATTETRRPRSRSLPSDAISWSSSGGWQGITDEDRTAWRTAYPACDLAGEFARMTEWLKANPAKAKKSRWRAFVTAWLTRSQNRGGGQASNRPGDRPASAGVSSRRWRDDACANMTDDQYAAWGRTQRPLGIARTLSAAISLRGRDSDTQTSNARPVANAEAGETDDESEEREDFDPIRDGWVGKDGRP